MPGLNETIERLLRGQHALQAAVQALEPALGDQMRVVREFGADPGALRMRLFKPPGLADGAPLVVTLHGCGQTAEGYAHGAGWLDLARRAGFAVLAPEQVSANNPNRCFNWFQPEDIRRGQGEAASIAAMIETAVRAERLDPARVFVTGLSAGGAMTAVMLATYPELFAGGAIIAGVAYGLASTVQEALLAMRAAARPQAGSLAQAVLRAAPARPRPVRLSIWQGDADAVVLAGNAADLAAQWAAVAGLPPEPGMTEAAEGRHRQVWGAGEADGPAIELNMIHGLGHGTPLSAAGPDGLGQAAPFLIEAGLSSTLEIARFWGLPLDAAPAGETRSAHEPEPAAGLADRFIDSLKGHMPAKVHAWLAKRLRGGTPK